MALNAHNAVAADSLQRMRLIVTGRVQGVGFRPTVYRYARALNLCGFVKNTPTGVEIEIEGARENIQRFLSRLKDHPPLQARIDTFSTEVISTAGGTDFQIVPSGGAGDLLIGIPPDLATCEDCARELLDPDDRRYRYPFINCTNCGPRFTIAESLPYDRHRTSMAGFQMCPACAAEYADPENRRFDAQPNACPKCGPALSLLDIDGERIETNDPLDETLRLLGEGRIVAIKSLGGYHLCCDARNEDAVRRLRERKGRRDKAFAVMFNSTDQVREYCDLSPQEEKELTSFAAPIVILNRRDTAGLSASIAPDTRDIGVFLPYTPLHYLLLAGLSPLVMTSCNLSEEPISRNEDDLNRILKRVADCALTHNRPIVHRCDDSVLKIVRGKRMFYRRSRGWVPGYVELPVDGPSVLAVGAELKSTFCVTRGRQAVLSQHIGDLTDYESMRFYAEAMEDISRLLRIQPEYIAHDPHPAYESTRYAKARTGVKWISVQHHHAHIASCMVENGLNEQVVGVALDGTGLGDDGTIWGGEFLVAGLSGYRRAGHFKTYAMPGGDEAVLHPDRMAMSCLVSEFGTAADAIAARRLPALSPEDRKVLSMMLEKAIHAPLTSSAGRLFDAVSALLGLCSTITYEGQAAIRLQTAASGGSGEQVYGFDLLQEGDGRILSFAAMFQELLRDLDAGAPVPDMALAFHRTVAAAVADMCGIISREEGLKKVVLSGGVFQNNLLLEMVTDKLNVHGLEVYCHTKVPPNDGGLSLGQAAVALAKIRE